MTEDQIIAVATEHGVVAIARADDVVTGRCEDDDVTVEGHDHIGPVGSEESVVAIGTDDGGDPSFTGGALWAPATVVSAARLTNAIPAVATTRFGVKIVGSFGQVKG